MYSPLFISQADPRPMYAQIDDQIRQRIAVGDWPPGFELPSIRTLAASTRVSVITVKRAYDDLERDGLIVTRQGKGSFVAADADISARLRLEEIDMHLRAAAALARDLGVAPRDLQARLRAALTGKDSDES